MYDVCIVGGGASGMACAITASKRGLNCITDEKEAKLGRKIYASGNGKCNLTNHNFDKGLESYYNSSDKKYDLFLSKLFKCKHPDKEITDFLFSIGIVTYDADSYVYPRSLQASSVMWAFTDMIKDLGIKILCKTCVEEIKERETGFDVKAAKTIISAKNVVLACGGAGYKSLGGSFNGYVLAGKLKIKTTSLRPSLCGLVTKKNINVLSGIRIKASATISDETGKDIKGLQEEGEIQFTDYGISGIMIFNLSGIVGNLISSGEKAFVNIDFLPDFDDKKITDLFEANNYRKPKAILNSLINDKLAGYIIDEVLSENKDKNPAEIKSKEFLQKIICKLHNFTLEIKELKDFDNAQVTAGGIELDEINPHDMSIKKYDGLYAIGEMTDIDGICGGYNLTYAFLSGIRAGEGIYDKIKSN